MPGILRRPAAPFVAATLLAATLGFVACGPAPTAGPAAKASTAGPPSSSPQTQPPAGALSSVLVSYSDTAADLPVWAADAAGLFRQHGLKVTLKGLGSGHVGVAALVSGQVQMAQLGGPEILSADAGGSHLVVVATLVPVLPFVFQTAPAIHSAAQLRGKKVGVAGVGGSGAIATTVALRKLGLTPGRDVSLVSVGSVSARTTALINGAIQGAVEQPPGDLLLAARGFHTLIDLATARVPFATNSVAVPRSYLTAHPQIVKAYLAALVGAIAWEKQHEAASVKLLMQYLRNPHTQAMTSTYRYYVDHAIPSMPTVDQAQFTLAVQTLAKTDPAVRKLSLAQVVDPTPLRQVTAGS